MNIQEYIASGILEQYVLGDVSVQEKKEVECLSHIYPEVKTTLQEFEITMEKLALQEAIIPSVNVKTKLFAQIAAEQQTTKIAPIVNIANTPTQKPKMNAGLMAAACLMLMALVSFIFYRKNANQEIAQLTTTIQLQQKNADSLLSLNKNLASNLSILSNPLTKQINLVGNDKVNKTSINLYWNKEQQQLVLTSVNFPIPEVSKQYQLWALVDGKPIDLGVFDVTTATQKMKNIGNAQAFAVTLEKKGGMPTPDLTQLCGIVNI